MVNEFIIYYFTSKTSIMRTAKTKAQYAEIQKTISGEEKRLGIDTFYEELPFDPKNDFLQALAEYKETHKEPYEGPKWGTWRKETFMEKEYKHQFENFAKGFLYYYEKYDGGTGEEHTVYFEWKEFEGGYNLTVFLKPFYRSWEKQERPTNTMVPFKRDPIPGPPTAGVDPPTLPPCPPPPRD
jgi:hypothetical protein